MSLVVLVLALTVFFHRSFLPGNILFSNDGPLGRQVSECHRLPDAYTGVWQDLEGVGYREGGAVPSITSSLRLFLGPLGFSKFYAPLALLLLGMSAWCFFRSSGLSTVASLLGGLAAALNGSFFSAACWGVAAHPITVGLTFLALAALIKADSPRSWLRAALAGFAVGLLVTEGYDIGALFSGCVAAFVLYQAFAAKGQDSWMVTATQGLGQLIVVSGLAALLATRAISVLVSTQIDGVAGTEQDTRTKQEKWDWSTQWSVPKREVLGLVVPGLFGFLVDSPNGGAYWGSTGRDAHWLRYLENGKKGDSPFGFVRQTGGGNYAGITVVMLALWALAESFRRMKSVFTLVERRWLWFWLALAGIALLLSFGRYAPFYRAVYALPYASTVRNPAKFLHVFGFALVILFGYGVDGLLRKYTRARNAQASSATTGLKAWWDNATRFEKNWLRGCCSVLGITLLGWCVYAHFRESLVQYLEWVEFNEPAAISIADFSIRQVGWFFLFFALVCGLMLVIMSGGFAGARAKWSGILLGLLVVFDLGRANLPWIRYSDYTIQYATNPILDQLADRPFEHRVAGFPNPFTDPSVQRAFGESEGLVRLQNFFFEDYRSAWLTHLFSYYNIQSTEFLDLVRVPGDLKNFVDAFEPRDLAGLQEKLPRYWQLTNTRYVLGAAAFLHSLNERLDPAGHRFHILARFGMTPRPGILQPTRWDDLTAVLDPQGPLALFEFTGALPRAKLYPQWLVNTNPPGVLKQLTSPGFDPEQTLLVNESLMIPASGSGEKGGTVEIQSYTPKRIILKANVTADSVLLLNDRYDPNWNVTTDGKPDRLLRCNFLMRGVHLSPGTHTVEFRFQPSVGALYISLSAIALAIVLLGLLAVSEWQATRQALVVPPDGKTIKPPRPVSVSSPSIGSMKRRSKGVRPPAASTSPRH